MRQKRFSLRETQRPTAPGPAPFMASGGRGWPRARGGSEDAAVAPVPRPCCALCWGHGAPGGSSTSPKHRGQPKGITEGLRHHQNSQVWCGTNASPSSRPRDPLIPPHKGSQTTRPRGCCEAAERPILPVTTRQRETQGCDILLKKNSRKRWKNPKKPTRGAQLLLGPLPEAGTGG